MSAHTHTTDEERSLEGDDRTERNSLLAEEFKHTEAGVWDVYEQIPRSVPRIPTLTGHFEIIKDMPFAWKMAKDVIKIESCLYHLCLVIVVEILASPVPAVALWFNGYYLTFVQVVINERRIDEKLLIYAFAGRICCNLVQRFLGFWSRRLRFPLGLLMKEHFDKEVFSAFADLDVPTRDDRAIGDRLLGFRMSPGNYGVIGNLFWGLLGLFSSLIRFATELCVLVKIIGHQPGGVTFAIIYIGQGVFELFYMQPPFYSRAVVAITNNEHYIKLAGLEGLVDNCIYRQEIVAGNLADFLKTAASALIISSFRASAQ